jgi:glycine/D-amino acid oxidase-like deaminating enzyme
LSTSNEVQAITLRVAVEEKTTIACKHLPLACGPWTPTVYERLFPSAPVHVQWATDAGDWTICKNPYLTTLKSTAFVSFELLIGEKFEFAGRNNGTIWAYGPRNFDAKLPPPGQSDDPDEEIIQEMNERAHQWLNWNCTCEEQHGDEVQILETGRASRPATKSGLGV